MNIILLGKDYWMNSMFSVARHYGWTRIDGHEYRVMPPADDLVRSDWVKIYTKYGRDKVLELLKDGVTDVRSANKLLSGEDEPQKETVKDTQLELFQQ